MQVMDASASKESAKPPKSERLRALLPDLWRLVRPRRGLLAVGLVLMAVNRVAGLVLPASTKYLIDDVIGQRRAATCWCPSCWGGGRGHRARRASRRSR